MLSPEAALLGRTAVSLWLPHTTSQFGVQFLEQVVILEYLRGLHEQTADSGMLRDACFRATKIQTLMCIGSTNPRARMGDFRLYLT